MHGRPSALRQRCLILLALLCLTALLPAASLAAPADDTAALNALVERFFTAYAGRDLEAFMALWDARSPDYAARRQAMQGLFAANSRIEVKRREVRRVTVDGAAAVIRVVLEMSVMDAKTGQPAAGFGTMNRTLRCVREAETWKVTRYAPAEDELAAALSAARTEQERQALLGTEKELVTPALVQALLARGNTLYRQGSYPEALVVYRLGQEVAERIGNRQGIANALNNIGLVHEAQGRYAPALEFFQRGLKLMVELGDERGIATVLGNIGNVHRSQGSYAPALEYYQHSLKLMEELGDKQGIANALGNIGLVHEAQGSSAPALEFFQRSLKLMEELGDKQGIANALNNIGLVHGAQGSYAPALGHYQHSLKLKEELGDKRGIANTLGNIGTVHEAQGSYAPALEFFHRSLKLAEDLGDKQGIANALRGIGLVHRSQGSYALALEYNQHSRKLMEELGDKQGIANALNNIGVVHRSQGSYAPALEHYQRGLKLMEELGDKQGIATVLGNIGIVHDAQGGYAPALEHYQRSLKLAEELGDKRGIANTLGNIGNVHEAQGSHASALEFFQRSRKLMEELGDKRGIANTLGNIGVVHVAQGSYAPALEFFQRSLKLADALGDPDTTYRCHWGIGNVYRAQGHPVDAIAAYQRAITALETIRRHVSGGQVEQVGFLQAGGKDNVYETLAELLVRAGRTEEALATLERARSHQFLNGIRLSALALHNETARAQLRRIEELEQQLVAQDRARIAEVSQAEAQQDQTKVANLTRLVAGTRTELLQAARSFRAAYPRYARLVSTQATDTRALRRMLSPNTLVVEYLPLNKELLCFLVTRDGIRVRRVPVGRKRIEAWVEALRTEIGGVQRRGGTGVRNWNWRSDRARPLREALTALYQHLVSPIRAEVARAETVVVVPSRALCYLPFQALARRRPDGSLVFFGEEKRIAHLSSLALLEQIRAEEATPGRPAGRVGRLGAFANPDGTLPGTEREVQRVGALFPGALLYLGAEATRARVAALPADVRLAHFATHGQLSERDINECYLKLANGEKLKLGEIYALAGKYPARLTVLSACETALGRPDPGNEVAHLASAFVEAGSTSIVASLWRVNDAATAVLMEAFYRALRAGKSRGEALHQAQIRLLRSRQTAHPYFWAPFILIGDWR